MYPATCNLQRLATRNPQPDDEELLVSVPPTSLPADIVIRAPKTDGEIEAFFTFANSVFSPSTPVEEVRSWQRWVQEEPGYHIGQMRCAFRDGRIVGTCLMHERTLRLGPARPAVAPVLLRALLPLWEERWRRAGLPYTGLLGVRIEGGEGAAITVRQERGHLSPTDDAPADRLSLPAEAFTQLICGYRSLDWALAARELPLPEGTHEALWALLPREPIWIPGSDAF